MKKLTKGEIELKYTGKPIYIKSSGKCEWYIVVDSTSQVPLHMLTEKESDLYEKNENSISGIFIIGSDCEESYAMWLYFNKKNGWSAYGYE